MTSELKTPLQALIEGECAFLRLNGTEIHPLTMRKKVSIDGAGMSHSARRKPCYEDIKKNLRVFVHGLPQFKRSKWQLPLTWCVANLLQRAGCEAAVKRGDLFAPLNGRAGGEFVRIDFFLARP